MKCWLSSTDSTACRISWRMAANWPCRSKKAMGGSAIRVAVEGDSISVFFSLNCEAMKFAKLENQRVPGYIRSGLRANVSEALRAGLEPALRHEENVVSLQHLVFILAVHYFFQIQGYFLALGRARGLANDNGFA